MTPTTIKDKVKCKRHAQDSIPSFIRKTYDILEERKFPEVIDWSSDGTALVIKKPSDFCQKVLPTYFKHNNLTSFVRQLNMYNFHKRRTQNIDHVYYHELFQRGKKHLLKEIKRKNHEHIVDKSQKIGDVFDSASTGKDFSSLLYENQFLKRLYNDAATKLALLESQVKDLSMQNQTLWTQICQRSENDVSLKTIQEKYEEKATELTQDQLPLTLGGYAIPPLKLLDETPVPTECPAKPYLFSNVNDYLNLDEESVESTEVSYNSPSLLQNTESEKYYETSESSEQSFPLTSQTSEIYQGSDLLISKEELSMGQVFGNWTMEAQSLDNLCFADTKLERNFSNTQGQYQDSGLLGKRPYNFEANGDSFNIPEPILKRNELSIFGRKGMVISAGTEDKELVKTFVRKENSTNEDYDPNSTIDLMDFNTVFCGWTKAA